MGIPKLVLQISHQPQVIGHFLDVGLVLGVGLPYLLHPLAHSQGLGGPALHCVNGHEELQGTDTFGMIQSQALCNGQSLAGQGQGGLEVPFLEALLGLGLEFLVGWALG